MQGYPCAGNFLAHNCLLNNGYWTLLSLCEYNRTIQWHWMETFITSIAHSYHQTVSPFKHLSAQQQSMDFSLEGFFTLFFFTRIENLMCMCVQKAIAVPIFFAWLLLVAFESDMTNFFSSFWRLSWFFLCHGVCCFA